MSRYLVAGDGFDTWDGLPERVETLWEKVQAGPEVHMQRGSALFGDHKKLPNLLIAESTWDLIEGGVANLCAAVDHVAGPRPTYDAAGTLLRGALENTAAAYWILSPRTRLDRIERYLTFLKANFEDERRAYVSLGVGELARFDAKIHEISTTWDRLKPTQRNLPGLKSTDVIKAIHDDLGTNEHQFLFGWRLLSGVAHGRAWADTSLRIVSMTDPSDAKELAAPAERTYFTARSAVLLAERAHEKFVQRATNVESI